MRIRHCLQLILIVVCSLTLSGCVYLAALLIDDPTQCASGQVILSDPSTCHREERLKSSLELKRAELASLQQQHKFSEREKSEFDAKSAALAGDKRAYRKVLAKQSRELSQFRAGMKKVKNGMLPLDKWAKRVVIFDEIDKLKALLAAEGRASRGDETKIRSLTKELAHRRAVVEAWHADDSK